MEDSKLELETNHLTLVSKLAKTTALSSLVLTAATAPVWADEALADLVEKVGPSVVTVIAEQNSASVSPDPDLKRRFGLPEGSPFDDFFKNFGPGNGIPEQFRNDQPREGLGSAFILSPEGWLVTNHHVVEGADSVTVRLADMREFDAEIVGLDEKTDLALLRIVAEDALPYVELGDSDEIRVGEDVMAVGNPFGLGGTVTSGIVSAKGRNISGGPYAEFLQTDAAINKGNSGGPLFNMDGEVVGVNSAIYSPTGGSVGVGFAVTSNIVELIVEDLKEDGEVSRGWLGVSVQNVTPDLSSALGLDAPRGALVSEVISLSPADGQLRSGDVILEFAGKDVSDSRALPQLVAATQEGAAVEIVVFRAGEQQTVTVQIGELAEKQVTEASLDNDMGATALERFGATVAPLDDETREKARLDVDATGVVVTALEASGPAGRAGVEVGDVILRIGDQDLTDLEDVEAALAKNTSKPSLLLVNRGGQQIFLAVDVA